MKFLQRSRLNIFYYARACTRAFLASTVISSVLFADVVATPVEKASAQIQLKKSSDRIEAAGILKGIRTPASARALNQALSREEDAQTILVLLDAIGSMPELASVPAISSKLARPEVPLRKRAAYVLGLAGGPRAERVLTQALLRENDAEVKAMLLQSLSVCGSADSVAAIQNATRDSRPHVRAKAEETLGYMPGHRKRKAAKKSK